MRRFTQHNKLLLFIEKFVKGNVLIYKIAFYIKNNFLRNYFHESDLYGLKLIKNNNKKKLIVDIGANVGQSIDFFKMNFKNRIYAFEPNLLLKKKLLLKFKKFKNVKFFFHAISDTNTFKIFYIPIYKGISLHHCASFEKKEIYSTLKEFLKIKKNDINFKTIYIKTKSLDSLNINPFIIKIDCEGHELSILKGMKNTLKKRPILFIENSKSNFLLLQKILYKKYQYFAYGYDKNENKFSTKKLSTKLNIFYIHKNDPNIKNLKLAS